jgi:2-oxo-4-hydroxy-4-carboxy--5-ureidoimidazoline (OHCU) decarboxylase
MLVKSNKEYEEKFPGLRYVVFVNGRARPVIIENMQSRIARGDIEAERAEAIQVCLLYHVDILWLRLISGNRQCAI